jgi:hypothetical protein
MWPAVSLLTRLQTTEIEPASEFDLERKDEPDDLEAPPRGAWGRVSYSSVDAFGPCPACASTSFSNTASG